MDIGEGKNAENKQTASNRTRNRAVDFMKFVLFYIVMMFFTYFISSLLQDFDATSRSISKAINVLKPYSRLRFTKVNDNRPSLKIAPILGEVTDIDYFNTYVAYDKNCLFIYDSLDLEKARHKIIINGEITNVSCVVKTQLFDSSFKYNINAKSGNGFYIFCQYKKDLKNMLICFNIPLENYILYNLVNNPGDEKIRMFKSILEELRKDAPNDPFFTDMANLQNVKHPGLTQITLFNISIPNAEFICHLYERGNQNYVVCRDNKNNLVFYNERGEWIKIVSFGSDFISNVDYYIGGSSLIVFDGEKMVLYPYGISALTIPIKLKNAYFLSGNYEHYSQYQDNIIIDNRMYELVRSNENGNNKCNLKSYDLDNTDQISYKYTNYFENLQGQYISTMRGDRFYPIEFKLLSQHYLFCDIPDIYDHTAQAMSNGFFISPAIDTSNNNKPSVIMYTGNHFFVADTWDIDEPVDEGYVTYEDNKPTIYFMNKNSIYRWQNSYEDFNNLKLRKLDLEPEPIKTRVIPTLSHQLRPYCSC